MEANNGKSNLIYAGLIGAVLSAVLPSPGDSLYFAQAKTLRDKWTNGEISAKKYWTIRSVGYFGYNAAFYLLVLGIVYSVKLDYNSKMKLLIALVGSGFLASVIFNHVKKDEENCTSDINAAKTKAFEVLSKEQQDKLISECKLVTK